MVNSVKTRKFLKGNDTRGFIEQLMELGELIAPKREEDVVSLRTIESPEEVESNFMQTSNNLRAIVEPQNEIILNFSNYLKPTIKEQLPSRKRKIALWCRPCDARALSSLDDTFIHDEFPDPYYQRRRESVILIGLGCENPFPFCFCKSVGGDPFGTDNLDILMTRVDDGFLLEPITENGEELLDSLSKEFTDASEKQLETAENLQKDARNLMPRTAPDPEKVVSKLENLFESPIWKKWGDKCIGCGICTYLCPTCWCFDLTDMETRGKGYRVRTWDSCQFPLFTLHSSGHNPRPDKGSRVRQRVMHKYRYHPSNYDGRVACVGCGRCTELCPEDIDLISILNDIAQEGDD